MSQWLLTVETEDMSQWLLTVVTCSVDASRLTMSDSFLTLIPLTISCIDSFQGTCISRWFNIRFLMDGYVIEYQNS